MSLHTHPLLAAVGLLALAGTPAAAPEHPVSTHTTTAGSQPAAAFAGPFVRRRHRLTVPPPPLDTDTGDTSLATGLAVNETEWAVRTSRTELAAGEVTLRVYNTGMDDHDLAVADAGGNLLGQAGLKAGADGSIKVTLAPGRYKLYCTLFGGTSESHEVKGMVAYVDVKTAP